MRNLKFVWKTPPRWIVDNYQSCARRRGSLVVDCACGMLHGRWRRSPDLTAVYLGEDVDLPCAVKCCMVEQMQL
jgi:hypothetical protein